MQIKINLGITILKDIPLEQRRPFHNVNKVRKFFYKLDCICISLEILVNIVSHDTQFKRCVPEISIGVLKFMNSKDNL